MTECAVGVGIELDVRPGRCHGCGDALTGMKRKWCGRRCEQRFWNNHAWTSARLEAIHRASVHEPLRSEARRAGYAWGRTIWRICDDCGREIEGAPEVNHVDPRLGQGYGPGCHHHQTNLQVLCHGCHAAETNRQRRERATSTGQTAWAA